MLKYLVLSFSRSCDLLFNLMTGIPECLVSYNRLHSS